MEIASTEWEPGDMDFYLCLANAGLAYRIRSFIPSVNLKMENYIFSRGPPNSKSLIIPIIIFG
jgi:hypothetical protein